MGVRERGPGGGWVRGGRGSIDWSSCSPNRIMSRRRSAEGEKRGTSLPVLKRGKARLCWIDRSHVLHLIVLPSAIPTAVAMLSTRLISH